MALAPNGNPSIGHKIARRFQSIGMAVCVAVIIALAWQEEYQAGHTAPFYIFILCGIGCAACSAFYWRCSNRGE